VGLLLSELLANSIQHSDSGKPGGIVTVTVTVAPGGVLAEVADAGGDGEPALREPPGDDSERGRGLRLVEELSRSWGWFGGKDQRVTWFELGAGQPS
jgi:anti-sigma regulatory factor (Ser/Thr protein kinase)